MQPLLPVAEETHKTPWPINRPAAGRHISPSVLFMATSYLCTVYIGPSEAEGWLAVMINNGIIKCNEKAG